MSKLKAIKDKLEAAKKDGPRYQLSGVVSSRLNKLALDQAESEQVESISELLNRYIELVEKLQMLTNIQTLSELVEQLQERVGKVNISQLNPASEPTVSQPQPTPSKPKPAPSNLGQSTLDALDSLML